MTLAKNMYCMSICLLASLSLPFVLFDFEFLPIPSVNVTLVTAFLWRWRGEVVSRAV